MRGVIGQRDARCVQTQRVASHCTRDDAGDGGTRGGGGAVIGLGEGAANVGGTRQGLGRDGGGSICNHWRREGIVGGHTAVARRGDGEGAAACGCDPVGGRHVRVVVGQRDARGVQAQGVTHRRSCDVADDGSTRCDSGAIVSLGQCAPDAGGGGQDLGSDGARSIRDGGCGEVIVRGHAAGRG